MTRHTTSAGHEASNAGWLDLHFESSRPEYEAARWERSAFARDGPFSMQDAGAVVSCRRLPT